MFTSAKRLQHRHVNRFMQSEKQLVFLPFRFSQAVSENSYTHWVVECWRRAGCEPLRGAWSIAFLARTLAARRRTIGVVNWLDTVVTGRSGRVSLTGTFAYFVKLSLLRTVCGKLYFVRHNVFPHATKRLSQDLARTIIDWSERVFFDAVFVHSEHYRSGFRRYVPHPRYHFANEQVRPAQSTDLVFFGRIEPYKQLEELIRLWDRDSRLTIAGRCADPAYLAHLACLARGRNIRIVTETLSDDAARDLLQSGVATILPHSGPDMIVSGSLYFSLSCGVPAICVASPHAESLRTAGMPGVVNVASLAAINDVGLEELNGLDRQTIHAEARRRFGPDAIARIFEEYV